MTLCLTGAAEHLVGFKPQAHTVGRSVPGSVAVVATYPRSCLRCACLCAMSRRDEWKHYYLLRDDVRMRRPGHRHAWLGTPQYDTG